jgi:hypothetical protein
MAFTLDFRHAWPGRNPLATLGVQSRLAKLGCEPLLRLGLAWECLSQASDSAKLWSAGSFIATLIRSASGHPQRAFRKPSALQVDL